MAIQGGLRAIPEPAMGLAGRVGEPVLGGGQMKKNSFSLPQDYDPALQKLRKI